MKVPFLDLKSQYKSIEHEIDAAVRQVVDSCAFAGGHFVEKFEDEFARFCGCEYAIGVGSGTEALWLSFLALGIGRGDEVITVPNTFIATVEAIMLCGAKPVFVDIDETTYNLDVHQLEQAITDKSKAIVPVHLFGQMADMDPIMEIAGQYGLSVIEDACQAHGADYHGKKAGTIGEAGCFSFYPGKNLGAYGDAGAIVTNNEALAVKAKAMRDHGQSEKYRHDHFGWNCRMDGLQGAVLSAKLRHLVAWTQKRKTNAKIYGDLLSGIDGIITPIENNDATHVYHIYAVRTGDRDRLMHNLHEKQIQTAIHYPIPIHMQKAFKKRFGNTKKFKKAEKCANELVSLPMFPEMTIEQFSYVADHIKKFIR